jgi:hypothetical protein
VTASQFFHRGARLNDYLHHWRTATAEPLKYQNQKIVERYHSAVRVTVLILLMLLLLALKIALIFVTVVDYAIASPESSSSLGLPVSPPTGYLSGGINERALGRRLFFDGGLESEVGKSRIREISSTMGRGAVRKLSQGVLEEFLWSLAGGVNYDDPGELDGPLDYIRSQGWWQFFLGIF